MHRQEELEKMFLNFSIPESVRKTYNKSFLYNATISLSYENIDDWNSKEDDIKQYLQNNGWKSASEQIRSSDGIFMSKNNSAVVISSRVAIISIPKPDYKGFESIGNIVDIKELLRVIGAGNIQNVFLSKNNRYVIKKELIKNPKNTFKLLFSSSFIKNYDDATGIIAISGNNLMMFSV